jgi:Tol biopolymer transport system component/tRNA A-37 threonylcarbamoyl transferase component Bud32
MRIAPGATLGPYELSSRIGAGGMGEVWKAVDKRLDRSVAIKVLPAELAGDAQFRIRFEREAKTISQLNHPHICVLHDVGQSSASGGDAPVDYLVMELLEGETLAARLARGPLPLDQVLRTGAEVADALAAAHRNSVIHRDLKPGNVMLTKSGAKLLDFGLARSIAIAPWGSSDASATMARVGSATATGGDLTAEGMIVGTFQYMAPEQLEGLPVDARTDIWALGALLYEMITGRRAFDGATKTSIIAAIVDRDPVPIRDSQPLTPPALEHIVARCLAKDPADRWQSAHDVAQELTWVRLAGSQAGVAAPVLARKRSRERIAWSLAAVLAIALVATAAMIVPKLSRASRPFVADIAAPRGMRFNAVGDEGGPVVLSPDGTLVVYSGADGAGNRLMLRSLVTGETRAIDGTENATFPFWSPDSRKVGFFNASHLMRVDVSGGAPVPICESAGARGGAWAGDKIVFTPNTQDPLSIVSAAGGKPAVITKMDVSQHTSHRWPSFLPDGRRFLYLACNHEDPAGSVNAVYLGSIDGGPSRMILRSVSNAVYADGWLLFGRDQMLYAQKVDKDLNPSGDPIVIARDVLYDAGVWRGGFSISTDGLLAYHSGRASVISNLQWIDRSGAVVGTLGEKDQYWDVALSPNGQRALIGVGDPQRELWIEDIQRKVRTKVTLNGWTNTAAWSPDGSTIYVDILRRGQIDLVAKRLDGAETILEHRSTFTSPTAVTPDGTTLFLSPPNGVLERLPLKPPGKAQAITRQGAFATFPTVSRNGRWLAYSSNENGRSEVFVMSIAHPEMKWQVTANGGRMPRWRGDDQELFFVDLSGHMSATKVTEKGDTIDFDTPQTLFTVKLRPISYAYDVTADGQKFLVDNIADEESPTVVLVNDWKARLQR